MDYTSYGEWWESVPWDIKSDTLWEMEAYRLALFIADVGWRDTTRLMRDKRTRGLSTLLSRSLGSISSNLAKAYSGGPADDLQGFFEQAVAAAKESRDWYYKGRHVLSETVAWHRVTLLTQIIGLIQADPGAPESAADRETLEALLQNVSLP